VIDYVEVVNADTLENVDEIKGRVLVALAVKFGSTRLIDNVIVECRSMFITLMKSKIHRATVTEANLDYVGSITIDEDLMEAADIMENEKVQVVDNNNGNRFETYVIKGERGSGMICLNGAAARLVHRGFDNYNFLWNI